jgi:hypothetical protein
VVVPRALRILDRHFVTTPSKERRSMLLCCQGVVAQLVGHDRDGPLFVRASS